LGREKETVERRAAAAEEREKKMRERVGREAEEEKEFQREEDALREV
jgi:hypothetical protein